MFRTIYDLIDGILLVRAEPEKQLDLQRLIKIILKLLPDALGIDRVRIVPLCFILISLICLRFWLLQNCAFGSTRIAVWAILYLRFGQAGGKVLDVDQAGSAQTTAFALDEVDVLQLPEQLDRRRRTTRPTDRRSSPASFGVASDFQLYGCAHVENLLPDFYKRKSSPSFFESEPCKDKMVTVSVEFRR